jgi:D-alanyl-D-alanine carboxypeptidase
MFGVCGLAFAAALAALGILASPPAKPARALTQLELKVELEALVKSGAPGAIAYLKSRDRISFEAVGVADLKSRRPPERNDVWRVASVTKVVTAAIVLKLAHDKKLDLDTRLGALLPGVLPRAAGVTVRQLLTHTSGIPDYAANPVDPLQVSAGLLHDRLSVPRSVEGQLKAAGNGDWTSDEPGAHRYSNTNYVLLGLILEKVTGRSYHDLVDALIIGPLKLRRTGFPDDVGHLPAPRLTAYVPGDGPEGPFTDQTRPVDVTEHTYFLGADGGLYSSVDDLSRMLDALWNYEIVDDHTFQSMFETLVPDHDGFYSYGEGIMAVTLGCGVQIFGHEGRDLGVVTQVFVTADNSKQFILAVNTALDAVPEVEAQIYELQTKVFCGN